MVHFFNALVGQSRVQIDTPPLEALEQTAMVDDCIIQKDFDFGA
jgi:hypothetical protein